MNLILFTAAEAGLPLDRRDPRAVHLLSTLRRQPGDTFDAGLIDGPRGKGRIEAIGDESLALSFAWGPPPPPLDPVTLLIGLPRPQTARDILRDATTLGATALHFVGTERSDPNYATSTLWSSGEWRRHCQQGAEQAFATRLPTVTWTESLEAVLTGLPAGAGDLRLALDNYEATTLLSRALAAASSPAQPILLALGPERGWGPADRRRLRTAGFTLAHLGERVLRLETAVTAALTLVQAARGQA